MIMHHALIAVPEEGMSRSEFNASTGKKKKTKSFLGAGLYRPLDRGHRGSHSTELP